MKGNKAESKISIEQQFKLLVENSLEAFLLIDKRLKIIVFSKTFCDLYSKYFGIEVLAGESILNYVQPERKTAVQQIYKKVFKGLEQISELDIPLPNGESVCILNKYKPVKDASGKKVEFAFVSCQDITVEKKSRKLLENSEKRYRKLVENSQDGIAILNKESKIIYLSPVVEDVLGYTPEEAIHKKIFPQLHPDDVKLKDQVVAKALKTPGSLLKAPELRVFHKDGSIQWVGSTFKNLLDDPLVNGIVVNFRNVTQKVLESQEQQINAAIIGKLYKAESLQEALQGVLQLFCAHFQFDLGEAWMISYSKDELYLTAQWKEEDLANDLILDKKLKFKYGEGLPGKAWKSQKTVEWDNIHLHKQFIRKASARKTGLKKGLGIPVFSHDKIIAVFTLFSTQIENTQVRQLLLNKITHQIGLDIQLKRSKVELNDLYNFSPQLICIVGPDNYLKRVNPAFTFLLGYSEEELLSRPFYEFVHPDDHDKSLDALEESMHGRVTRSFENRYITKSGGIKWISWHSSELLDQEGIIYGFGTDITAIKTANLELFKYKNVIEHSQNAVSILTLKDEKRFINPAYSRMFGYSQEELQKLNPFSFYIDREKGEEVAKKLYAGEVWNGDIELESKQGEKLSLHLNGGAVKNKQGKIIALYCIYTDISRRKQDEEKLLYKSKLLDINARSSNMLIREKNWLEALDQSFRIVGEALDLDRVYYFENSKLNESGYVQEYTSQKIEWTNNTASSQIENPDLQNIPFSDIRFFVEPLSRGEAFKAIVNKLPESNLKDLLQAQDIKSILVLPVFIQNEFYGFIGFDDCQNERVWSEDEYSFLQTLTFNVASLIENRNSELAVKESQQKFESVIRNMPGITYRCAADEHWTMHFISDEIERLTGYPASDFIQNKVRSFASIIIDKGDVVTKHVQHKIKAREVFNVEYKLKCADGSEVWVEEKGQGIFDENGALKCIDGVIMDISEKKKNQKKLRKLNKELEKRVSERTAELKASNEELEMFTFAVSHELRSPLRFMNFCLTSIINKPKGTNLENILSPIQDMNDACNKMYNQLEDLLAFSRVGKQALHPCTFDMRKLFEQVAEILKQEYDFDQYEIQIQNLPQVYGDEKLLFYVVQNLFSNALKYSAKASHPKVVVRAKEKDEQVIYIVEDNGVGFNMKYYPKIFENFERLHSEDQFPGNGAGLSIAQRVLNRHGGEIWAEAKVNEGATFYFTLPKVAKSHHEIVED